MAEITSPLSPYAFWHRGTPTAVIFPVKTFEYHIRIVGGLLGAFAVSGRRELLRAAAHAADCVLTTFATPNGIPRPFFRVAHPTRSPLLSLLARFLDGVRLSYDPMVWQNYLASIGSFGLELRVLTRETGDQRYAGAADALHALIYRRWVQYGRQELLPWRWAVPPPTWAVKYFWGVTVADDPFATPMVGFGSAGDSYYEYLVKEQLFDPGDATASQREIYDHVAKKCHHRNSSAVRHDKGEESLGKNGTVTVVAGGGSMSQQPHLACFAGGMFALGAKMLPGHAADAWLAAGITEQCLKSYTMTQTGLGPEITWINASGGLEMSGGRYHLRPEVIESLFVLFRTTGEERYVLLPFISY